MAGSPEGGIGPAASDRRLPQQWQAGSSRDSRFPGLEPGLPGMPHRMPSSSIAQCSPLPTDSSASQSPLAEAQDAYVIALDQVRFWHLQGIVLFFLAPIPPFVGGAAADLSLVVCKPVMATKLSPPPNPWA